MTLSQIKSDIEDGTLTNPRVVYERMMEVLHQQKGLLEKAIHDVEFADTAKEARHAAYYMRRALYVIFPKGAA
jgi:hypothetical protein